MPRTADPELPHRILKAADALWQSGGEEAVTIRLRGGGSGHDDADGL